MADEITRLRTALDEALSDHLCACGYGAVCGQCQRVDRARAEAAESALAAMRASVEALADEWQAYYDRWKGVHDGPRVTIFNVHARKVRALLASSAPATASENGPRYQPCNHECNGCPTCDPGLATGVTSPDGDRGLSERGE